MPVPSSLNDLSTTPSLNSPAGSESPALVDDYLRTHAAFIKQVNDASVKTTGDQTVAGVKTFTGNVVLGGTGQRITGDFSNATVANRVMFQTSTANSQTSVLAIPNGTGTVAQFISVNNSDPTNASIAQLAALSTEVSVRSGITGTGTYLSMTFHTSGSERMRIDTSGNVLVTNNTGGLGYGAGAGGAVTQATSKGTAVTLNKPTGAITMNNASLSAGGTVIFAVNNTLMTTNDTVVLTLGSVGTGLAYNCWCPYSANGTFYVALQNISGGPLAEAVVVKFAIIKGATS